MAPFSGSMNLLSGSQNSETFSSLGHQLILEGYNSGTAGWKKRRGRGMGTGHGALTPSPGGPVCSTCTCSRPEAPEPALLGSYRSFITEAGPTELPAPLPDPEVGVGL